VVLLTFTIGILNICLGYAVAVYLGYGPASWIDGWDALLGEAPPQQPIAADWPQNPAAAAAIPPAAVPVAVAVTQPVVETPPAVSPEPADAPAPPAGEKFVELGILKFNAAIVESGVKIAAIETRLRSSQGQWDAAMIESCVAELEKDSEEYMAEQERLAEEFRQRMAELGEMAAVGDQIEMGNLAACAQLETTVSNLKHMDFHSDLQAAGTRLLEEIDNLRAARHYLRDNQDVAFLAVARHEHRLGQVEPRVQQDRLTRGPNRIGLETTLWQWWQEGKQQKHEMGVVLVDIDKFGKLNGKHGSLVGDRLLSGFANVLREIGGPEHLLARYAGQRFIVVMRDIGPRSLVKAGETLRQSIERTVFLCDGEKIGITISMGIAAVAPDESIETLLDRAEKSLQHAKHGGPNRASFDNGKDIQTVESPEFHAEYREVMI